MLRRSIIVALALLLPVSNAAAQAPVPFEIIVNVRVAGAKISRQALGDIFLRRVTRWGDGSAIAPVDQSATSAVRASFSQRVLEQSVIAVQTYWARQIGGGRTRPPAVKGSDAAVVQFVAENAGGVGYVSAETELPDTVKLVQVE